MVGFPIPRKWKKQDLAWAMFNAQRRENPFAIMGDYDKLLAFGFEHVRTYYGFNVDYTKYPTDVQLPYK